MNDLISRQDAIDAFGLSEKTRKYGGDHSGYDTMMLYEIQDVLESLPSAEAEDRLYIKIYADDEPSVMAEKLYQICDETQNGEVAEWLKEYFPSADSPTGEWIEAEVIPEVYDIEGVKTWGSKMQCDQCGFRFMAVEGHIRQYNYCPNCGAKMEGREP